MDESCYNNNWISAMILLGLLYLTPGGHLLEKLVFSRLSGKKGQRSGPWDLGGVIGTLRRAKGLEIWAPQRSGFRGCFECFELPSLVGSQFMLVSAIIQLIGKLSKSMKRQKKYLNCSNKSSNKYKPRQPLPDHLCWV